MVVTMSKLGESAFGLSEEELEQIRLSKILKRRKDSRRNDKKRFSDFLSPEAQIAMQLAYEDTKAASSADETNTGADDPTLPDKTPQERVLTPISEQTSDRSSYGKDSETTKPLVKNISFTELYEANSVSRMDGDITDSNFNPSAKLKRALTGAKVESAMEIVETVIAGGEIKQDEFAIEEIAKQNAVDKCAIWMEAAACHDTEYEEMMEYMGDS